MRVPIKVHHDTARFVWRAWAGRRVLLALTGFSFCVSAGLEILVALLSGHLVDAMLAVPSAKRTVVIVFATLSSAGLAVTVTRYVGMRLLVVLSIKTMSTALSDRFARVQRLATHWHEQNPTGEVQRTLTRGMWALDTISDLVLRGVLPMVVATAAVSAYTIIIWPGLGSLLLIGAAAYLGTILAFNFRILNPASELLTTGDTKLSGSVSDSLMANSLVKAANAEDCEDNRLGREIAIWAGAARSAWLANIGLGSIQVGILWLTRVAITGYVLWEWTNGRANVGDLTFLIASYLIIQGYMQEVGWRLIDLQRVTNEVGRLAALDEPELDPAAAQSAQNADDVETENVIKGRISFRNVCFRYPGATSAALTGLSFDIAAGEHVGVVGRSGSGKTTLTRLLRRLYEVTEGSLLIDGVPISQLSPRTVRRAVMVVTQETVILNRSVAENIAFGHRNCSREMIERAAEKAEADAFVRDLPAGYDTLLGERGSSLSGGQRQRIGIARAFLSNSPILILDEPTANLDPITEAAVIASLQHLMEMRTSIIISHQLGIMAQLDRIVTIDAGMIVEDGRHSDLVEADGSYNALLRAQQATGEMDASLPHRIGIASP